MSESLEHHPKPEILLTTLETPILKLKIYDSNCEPNKILSKTINPSKEGRILSIFFNLEKVGALIKGELLEINTKEGVKKFYKWGLITKIGRILLNYLLT